MKPSELEVGKRYYPADFAATNWREVLFKGETVVVLKTREGREYSVTDQRGLDYIEVASDFEVGRRYRSIYARADSKDYMEVTNVRKVGDRTLVDSTEVTYLTDWVANFSKWNEIQD
jgi:hypothetical protein